MKTVIAIDSFKGSLTTFQAGKAIEEAVKQVYKDAKIIISPIADGGEGTSEAIISAVNGEIIETFKTKLSGVYADATVLYEESL